MAFQSFCQNLWKMKWPLEFRSFKGHFKISSTKMNPIETNFCRNWLKTIKNISGGMNSNVIGFMFELQLVSSLGVTETNFVDFSIGNKTINK